MPDAEYASLPFQEAIDYFRQKLNVPTHKWTDVREGAHTRAFVVAGAAKEDLLEDFRAAVDKAISEGTTLAEFRKDFDQIVAKHGWSYNGGRGWRTNVIYQTNLSTAYAAGRWQQMTDPDVLRYQPYWRYRHADGVKHPRLEHKAWDGLTLKADDPWWKTHYPPNGWGCHCYVEPITRRELAASGKHGPDTAPPSDNQRKVMSTSSGPVTIEVPKGVDPGWGYSVGETAFGRELPKGVMDAWRDKGAGAWQSLTPGDWRSAGRPEQVPLDRAQAKPGGRATSEAELARSIARVMGGEQVAAELPNGDPLLIDAAALASHLPLDRAGFVPFLPEMLDDPYEIWLSFEQHKGTGKVELRKRVIKVIDTGIARGMVLVGQSVGGMLEAWTLVPMSRLGYLQSQRVGRLLWGR